MRGTMSLLGLFNYDNTILDGLILPENFAENDIDMLKENLLMETAELEILYTDPAFLKFAITSWCSKNSPTWKWLYDTQHYDYNPIWNADYHQSDRTDRTENNIGTATNTEEYTRGLYESEDTRDTMSYNSDLQHKYESTLQKTYAGTSSEEHSGDTDTETRNHIIDRDGTETTEHQVSAYNQTNAYSPESRDIHEVDHMKDTENGHVIFDDNIQIDNATNYTDTDVHSGNDTDTHTGTDTRVIDRDLAQTGGATTTDNGRTTSDTDTNQKYEKWLRGNYGQTTTQQMIREEQELAKKNIFDYIICDFKKRFCLMVY